jgi:hypothetical protein
MRERWGTFSVRDHLTDAPFVTDVLLYDRLIIPVPDPADTSIEQQMYWRSWEPEKQQTCLDIRKIKTPDKDGLTMTVPWTKSKRGRFTNRISVAKAVATQQRTPDQDYYMDPYMATRELIRSEFLPALPAGVSKAWTVVVFGSTKGFEEEVASADPRRERRLAMMISHRFLTPVGSDPKHELLKRAVDLTTTGDYRQKRARFYEWQENIIEENISDEKAIEEMERLLGDYNKAIKKAFTNVGEKYLFTAVPVSLGIISALVAGTTPALLIGGIGGLVQLARFWRFDRKPKIEAGDADAAAMIHDARNKLPLT